MRARSACGAEDCNEAPQESRGRRTEERERFGRPCEGADNLAWDVSQPRLRHGFAGHRAKRKRRANSLAADTERVFRRRAGLTHNFVL